LPPELRLKCYKHIEREIKKNTKTNSACQSGSNDEKRRAAGRVN
jgi:hypothetical protein